MAEWDPLDEEIKKKKRRILIVLFALLSVGALMYSRLPEEPVPSPTVVARGTLMVTHTPSIPTLTLKISPTIEATLPATALPEASGLTPVSPGETPGAPTGEAAGGGATGTATAEAGGPGTPTGVVGGGTPGTGAGVAGTATAEAGGPGTPTGVGGGTPATPPGAGAGVTGTATAEAGGPGTPTGVGGGTPATPPGAGAGVTGTATAVVGVGGTSTGVGGGTPGIISTATPASGISPTGTSTTALPSQLPVTGGDAAPWIGWLAAGLLILLSVGGLSAARGRPPGRRF